MMSFDLYPDAVTVQTDVATKGGGGLGVASVGGGDMYPDTDAFWSGGASGSQRTGFVSEYAIGHDYFSDSNPFSGGVLRTTESVCSSAVNDLSDSFAHCVSTSASHKNSSCRGDNCDGESNSPPLSRNFISGVENEYQDSSCIRSCGVGPTGSLSTPESSHEYFGDSSGDSGLNGFEPQRINFDAKGDSYQDDYPDSISYILINQPNWDNISSFDDNPRYFVGSSLGKAFAKGPGDCTSWNIGGPFAITAAHCNAGMPSIDVARDVMFTKDGCLTNLELIKSGFPSTTPRSFDYGDPTSINRQAIKNRLIDLGIPESSVYNLDESLLNGFFKFQHKLYRNYLNVFYGCRDIEVYRAEPETLGYMIYGQKQKIALLPSHLYGSVPFFSEKYANTPYYKRIGRPVYALSVNRRITGGAIENLLSPDGYLSYPPINEPSPSHSLTALGLHLKGGSSGGALMDLRANEALGVYSRNVGPYDTSDMIPDDVWRLVHYRRPYSDPLERSEHLLFGTPHPSFNFKRPPSSWSRRFGPIGSALFSVEALSCPPNYAAAGIIASTVTRPGEHAGADSMIGNLGMICLPYRQRNAMYPFDYATVIAGGSFDTNILPISKMNFDDYYSKIRSVGTPDMSLRFSQAGIPQSFAMCPPGYYLRGIHALPGFDRASRADIIRQIYQLDCRRADFGRDYRRRPRIGMGGSRFTRVSSPTSCIWGFVSGMRVYKGDITYGFELDCKIPGKAKVGQTSIP